MSSKGLVAVNDAESIRDLKKYAVKLPYLCRIIVQKNHFRIYDALVVPHARPKLCFLFYFIILPAYTCFGGVIFWLTDFRISHDAQMRFDRVCIRQKQAVIRELWASYIALNISQDAIHNFWNDIAGAIEFVDTCHRENMRHLRPKTFEPFQSVVFSFAVITTIGYGDVAVQSTSGRLLSILYAVIGIPLNVAFTADFGEMIANAVTDLIDYFRKLYATYTQRSEGELTPLSEKRKFIVLTITTIIFITVVACIVMYLEKEQQWDYIDSLHFTFASASLIGYGDLTSMKPAAYVFLMMPLFFVGETLLCLVYGFIQTTFRFHAIAVVRLIILEIRRAWHRKKHRNVRPTSTGNVLQSLAESGQKNSTEAIENKIQSELNELNKMPVTNTVALLSVPIQSDREVKRALRSRIKEIITEAESKEAPNEEMGEEPSKT